MLILALSSGTSVDAVDVALVDFHSHQHNLEMRLVEYQEYPWPPQLRQRILDSLPPARIGVEEVCQLDTLVGQHFANLAQTALTEWKQNSCDLIVSHGQTLFHWVENAESDASADGTSNRPIAKGTLQVGNPSWIAEKNGIPVLSDLRSADIAAGGHGAPLASTLDAFWLGELAAEKGPIAAVNIGGISNVTIVKGVNQPVLTWDVGPGNCLLDPVVQQRTQGKMKYDIDGKLAASGTVNQQVLAQLLTEPYYQLPAPKSSGRELFNGDYLARMIGSDRLNQMKTADLMATLTELTAVTIANAVRAHGVGLLVVSGGGAANQELKRRLSEHLVEVVASDELGIPSDAKEGCLFALLGYLSAMGVSGTVAGLAGKQATGALHPVVLGSLTPANAQIYAGEVTALPTSLHVFKENNNVK